MLILLSAKKKKKEGKTASSSLSKPDGETDTRSYISFSARRGEHGTAVGGALSWIREKRKEGGKKAYPSYYLELKKTKSLRNDAS